MKRPKMMDLKVREFMSTDLATATPDEPLSKIIGLMKARDVHEIPIVLENKLLGLVTLAEIARRRDMPPTTKAERVLSSAPQVSPEDDLPSVAEKMMGANLRALPVTEKNRLVGLISRTDITRALAQAEEADAVPVKDVMSSSPLCVNGEAEVTEARRIMASLHERSVPVVDDERRLIGVIGLKDLTAFFASAKQRERKGDFTGEKNAPRVRISSLMRSPPITLGPEAKLGQALKLMIQNDISSIVVTENSEPVGLVTKADVLEVVAGFKERKELLVQISGLEEQPDVYEQMYDIIQKGMKRIAGIVTPRIFSVHVVTYKGDGDRTKWSLRCRLSTTTGMIYARHFDWDLFAALEGLLDQLESRIKKEKDKKVAERRRGFS
jgi:CBS domain-containing protein